MTPEEFNKLFSERLAANPAGMPVDEYLELMVTLMKETITQTYGIPAHITLLVGTRIGEVKMRTTLSDEHFLSLMSAVCEHMALKHTPPTGEAS